MYDRANDNFRPALPGALRDIPASDVITGPGENVWIAFDTVICSYNPRAQTLKVLRLVSIDVLQPGVRGQYPSIAFDNDGRPWLFYRFETDYKVFRGEISGDSIICHYEASLPYGHYRSSSLHNDLLNPVIHISGRGTAWLFCKYGLFRCDTLSNEFTPEKEIDNEDFRGRPFFFWSDDEAGINILNTGTGTLVNLPAPEGKYVECKILQRYRRGGFVSFPIWR